jgi:hypothetical protein
VILKRLIFGFCVIFIGLPLFSQERQESSLNYTFLGPIFSYSINSAQYSDWVDNERKTQKLSGRNMAGGLAFKVIAGDISGDLHWKYSYSQYDSTITCLEYDISAMYLYTLNKSWSLGGGFGLFMETPPSNVNHDGAAGIYIPIEVLFSASDSIKIFVDLFGKYGTFAIGDNTKFQSFGLNLGVVFKVGRI